MPRGDWVSSDSAQEIRSGRSLLLAEAMASCTAVTYVNGNLVGDPLDVQMFEATGWVLDETDQSRNDPEGTDQMIIAYVSPKTQENRA